MSLSVIPVLNALALTVVVEATEIGVEYAAEVEVGSEPSRVYRIVAPIVLHWISID